ASGRIRFISGATKANLYPRPIISAAMATRTEYLSISKRGIDFSSVPMRLFQKSKKLGIWDPMAFDLAQDKQDWALLSQVRSDDSNEALARALTTYNMMIEGVLAETGYHSYSRQLEQGRLFPGLAAALRLISRDETRHIRFGVYMLQLLIQEDPAMWEVVQGR